MFRSQKLGPVNLLAVNPRRLVSR